MAIQRPLAGAIQIGLRRIKREPEIADLLPETRFGRRPCSPDRHLRLPPRHVDGRVARRQVDPDFRMLRPEPSDDPRRQVLGEGFGACQAHPAGQLPVRPQNLQTQRVEFSLHALPIGQGRAPSIRHHVSRRKPLEEPHTGLLLHRVDPPEDRRMGLPQLARSPRQAFVPADGEDQLQVVPFQFPRRKSHHSPVRFCKSTLP